MRRVGAGGQEVPVVRDCGRMIPLLISGYVAMTMMPGKVDGCGGGRCVGGGGALVDGGEEMAAVAEQDADGVEEDGDVLGHGGCRGDPAADREARLDRMCRLGGFHVSYMY